MRTTAVAPGYGWSQSVTVWSTADGAMFVGGHWDDGHGTTYANLPAEYVMVTGPGERVENVGGGEHVVRHDNADGTVRIRSMEGTGIYASVDAWEIGDDEPIEWSDR